MNDFLSGLAKLLAGILIRAVIAFAICCIYALIHMATFGTDSDLAVIESILLLIGSIVVSNVIVNKFSNKKK